jgi:hypothetical protein
LPRAIAVTLLTWKNTHRNDADRCKAFDQLMDELRRHPDTAGMSPDDARQRAAEIRRILKEFAQTHMTEDERTQLEAELNLWARASA